MKRLLNYFFCIFQNFSGTVEICWTHNEPILTLRSVGIQKDNVRAKINRNMIEHLLLISASFEEDLTKFGEMTMRDLIIQSLCPSIHGLYMIKLAMALILCSSSGEESGDSSKTRGVCHLMLVGDPGMGKSKLLAAATNCAPISVAITGFSSTAAGLTAAASKVLFLIRDLIKIFLHFTTNYRKMACGIWRQVL